jgi:hypothetical protein
MRDGPLIFGISHRNKMLQSSQRNSARLSFNNRVIRAGIVHRRLNPTTTTPKLPGTGCLNNFFFIRASIHPTE